MTNTRTVTFVVEFDPERPPKFLWDAHLEPNPELGYRVIAIVEGNTVSEYEKLEKKTEKHAEVCDELREDMYDYIDN